MAAGALPVQVMLNYGHVRLAGGSAMAANGWVRVTKLEKKVESRHRSASMHSDQLFACYT
jgi:hypothetical protein